MALTAGQQKAADNLAHIQGTTWRDWVPATQTGSSNPYGVAWYDQQFQNMYNQPEGTYTNEQFQYAQDQANKAAQGGDQTLGQRFYDQQLAAANESVKWWNDNPDGHEQSFMDNFMFKVMPVVALAMMGGYALMGEGMAAGAGGASAGGVGTAGVGAAEVGAAGIGSAGAVGGGAGAAGAGGVGAGAVAAGGTGAAAATIPTVHVVGSLAGAGAGGIGAGGIAAGAAGLGGLAAMAGEGGAAGSSASTTTEPQRGSFEDRPPISDGLGSNPQTPINNAALEQMPAGVTSGTGSTLSSYMDTAKDLKSIYDGIMPYVSGNVDRINARQDADFWKGQLDTLGGMYKPGTPEAELMRQKMEAQDAASGRRSQYGIRAVNLASQLADKRAGIMTSAGYQNMANAYRNRSSNDLNGLFAAAGNGSGSNNSGWMDAVARLGATYMGSSAQ